MSENNVHSTLFFKYLRGSRRVILFFTLVIFIHFLLLFIFPGHSKGVSDIIWVFSEIFKITMLAIAFRKSRDLIRKGWLFMMIYGVLIFTAILIRSYNDLFLHTNHILITTPYLFAFGNIAVIIAFIQFSLSREVTFKIRRQLNLLGLILVTIVFISYLITYSRFSNLIGIRSIVIATIAGVINLSAFIIGLGIYWISIWKKESKRRRVFIFILSSVFISFILNNLYFTKKFLAGESLTGGYPDIFGTAAILLIAFAAWYELNFEEQIQEKNNYNLFYVSRIERIIPVISLAAILTTLYFNLSRVDATLIKTMILMSVPYCVFLLLFELYSYRSEDAILGVLAVSPTGVLITSRDFKKTYFINQSLFDIFRSSEIPSDIILRGGIPEELKNSIISSVSDKRILNSVELILSRPDGTKFNAQCKIIPSRYYSYNIVITWIWDITDRKKYEDAILQQKYSAEVNSLYKSELLNNLSNRMQSGYVTMKPDNSGWPDLVMTGMNPRILEHFNFKENMTGRTFYELFPFPDTTLIQQFFEVLSTGESLKRELFVRRAGKIFMLLIFKASEDELACLVDDITESKQKEKALIERERELSTLLGNIPGMAYRCRNDKEWTMFFVSQGSFDLSGYKPEELVEGEVVSWTDIIHPDDREKVWLGGQDAINRGESFYLDYRIITKDKIMKYVWEKGIGVFDESGELAFLEGFIFDITKQKEAEAVLHRHVLKENEMEKARALGQMAGGIAHDLNNRLMGIGSYTSLIDLKAQDPNLKKYTSGIQESVLKSAELIESLLIFARQSEKITDIFSVHGLLRELVFNTERELTPGLSIKASFSAADDNVDGDHKQIYKAVSDIVSNAIDAMPGGGQIVISTENKTVDKNELSEITEGNTKKLFIVIHVSDGGHGIEKENLSRIFDPFYTTKPVGKGKGLGLSAVYGSIQAHKGAITVDSAPGKGAVFSIYLPVNPF